MDQKFNSWKWQLANSEYRVDSPVTSRYPFFETPYSREFFLGNDVLENIYTPNDKEINLIYSYPEKDVMGDTVNTVMQGVVHKYDSRVLILTATECPLYCRYCTRKNSSSDLFNTNNFADLYKYTIEKNVNEIILSGGDPFMLENHDIEMYLQTFDSWDHIDIIRIHSKVPVTLPMRFYDQELLAILKRYSDKLWIVTHVVSHFEFNDYVRKALKNIRKCDIVLLNQNPVLKGINDSVEALQKLFYSLIRHKIKPYYLFQIDQVDGSASFYVDLTDVLSMMKELQGSVSGISLPKVIVDIPHGLGKVPVENTYILTEDEKSYHFVSTSEKEGVYYKF